LKEISIRLKSITNIQKITASMKMVSAAKFARAEAALKQGRPSGNSSVALVEKAGVELEDGTNKVFVLMSSDRGLCGGVHSAVGKFVKRALPELPAGTEGSLVCVGDKVRLALQRLYGKNIVLAASGVGKKPPTFTEAAFLAANILGLDTKFDSGSVVYNRFNNAASYTTSERPIITFDAVKESEALTHYDDIDGDTLQSYTEFNLATNVFYCMLESQASEQSSRMSAMENATNNAGDMIAALTRTFNRTRQAVITTELIEIISGAAAME